MAYARPTLFLSPLSFPPLLAVSLALAPSHMGFGAKCNLARFLGLYGFVNRCGRVQSLALHVSVTLYFSCSLSIGVKHVSLPLPILCATR